MGLKWSGRDLGDLQYALVARVKKIELDAHQILDDISREAVADMRRIIEGAVTDTGRARAESGEGLGQPGRIDTSAMISDVTYALDNGLDGDVVLTWGWVDHLERYYLVQNYGPEEFDTTIKAMSALQGSYMKAREKLRQRFQDLGLEVH